MAASAGLSWIFGRTVSVGYLALVDFAEVTALEGTQSDLVKRTEAQKADLARLEKEFSEKQAALSTLLSVLPAILVARALSRHRCAVAEHPGRRAGAQPPGHSVVAVEGDQRLGELEHDVLDALAELGARHRLRVGQDRCVRRQLLAHAAADVGVLPVEHRSERGDVDLEGWRGGRVFLGHG